MEYFKHKRTVGMHIFLFLTKKFLFIIIPGVLLFFNGCALQKERTVLKLAHGLDTKHPVHKGMEYMAERLKEKSEGTLTIQIYPSEQLGPERECVELLQIGSLAMTKVSAAIMEGFVPKYRVLSLPYIFQSKEASYAVLDGEIGEELLLSSEKFWLRGLTFYDAGARSFYTKDKPIRTPEDLEGMKIRVMNSNIAVNMIRAFGGSPTPISFGELYSALQQGVVDGAENNPPSFYLSHHYEVCNYYSISEHAIIPDVLLISTLVWEQLSEQEQQWLEEAANESAEHQRILWAESDKESLEAVKEAGIEVIYPDKKPFAELANSLHESFKDEPEMYELIQRIKAVQKEDN